MSEQIFKAWDNKNKKWVDNFLIDCTGTVFIDDSYESGENFHIKRVKAKLCMNTTFKIKRVSLFENDIIQVCGGNIYIIKFLEGGFVCSNKSGYDTFAVNQTWLNRYDAEIIGNIFEHKHLLEAKK